MAMSDEAPGLAAFALASVRGVGPVLMKRLLQRFGSAEAALAAPLAALCEVEGVGETVARGIAACDVAAARRAWDAAIATGASILMLDDAAYPEPLRAIPDPPPVLYMKGRLAPEDRLAIAVVGSRTYTMYGRSVTEAIAGDLARAGVTIVSGLARGIDSIAHRAALAAGGRTIAVLGSGLDVVYPPEHGDLYGEIAARGAVLTEFPPGTLPAPENFPRRNRVISGLALGTLVVEAPARSGALITARHALDQGREVFAVPGAVTEPGSHGTNALIQRGATLVQTASDILEQVAPQAAGLLTPRAPAPVLAPDAARVYAALSARPVGMDAIVAGSGLAPQQVAALLLQLELDNHVRQLPGMTFVRVTAP